MQTFKLILLLRSGRIRNVMELGIIMEEKLVTGPTLDSLYRKKNCCGQEDTVAHLYNLYNKQISSGRQHWT